MVELADAQDLGSCAARRVGSTPTTRTKTKPTVDTIIDCRFVFYAENRRHIKSSPFANEPI